jgi:hypothetical protein
MTLRQHTFTHLTVLLLAPLAALHAADASLKPNIVLLYADDIGYGDLGCYGATKVKAPNCDKLAAAGLRFTDAHAVAAVCTPSRYSLLTGEYAFRKKGTGIASGIDGLLIDADRATLPSMLKDAGYTTGIVGKWHLGLGTKPTHYNEQNKPGPNEIRFDYSWIIPATGDRVPCVWVENRRVVKWALLILSRLTTASFVNGVSRIGGQKGGKVALWEDDEISFVIAQKSCEFLTANSSGAETAPKRSKKAR